MSDIVDAVVSRVVRYVYPNMYPQVKDDIVAMVQYQLDKIDVANMTEMDRLILIEKIVTRYRNAMMLNREQVGTIGSQTIAENLVQSSLSSHHHAGLRRGAVGFDRMNELTDLSDTGMCKVVTTPLIVPGPEGNIIVPRDKSSIHQLANSMVKILMRDITESYELVSIPDSESHPSWYPLILQIMGKSMESVQREFIRINVSKELIYKYRISLPVIAEALNAAMGKIGIILYPPISLGTYIDIHVPTDQSLGSKYRRMGQLFAVQVGGVNSVETAYTSYENMLNGLRIKNVGDDEYELIADIPDFTPDFVTSFMIQSMVPDAVMVIGSNGRRFTSEYGYNEIKRMILEVPIKYGDILDEDITLDDGRYMLTFRNTIQIDGTDIPLVDAFPYLEYADTSPIILDTREQVNNFLLDMMVDRHLFWYIECICHRIQDIFVIPEVDAVRSYTTSPLNCMETLGYLAMRQMLYDEIKANIRVDELWLKLLVNNMTAYKHPVAIRRHSIRYDKSEWMTYTAFEDILKWVTYAAFTGEVDTMKSISSHVITGKPIETGRGGINLTKGNKFVAAKKKIADEQERIRRQHRKTSSRKSGTTKTAIPATGGTTA